ncbi:DUF6894 family protein [Methylobacterium segetis]|uniref:DUF6894 family protein n=1 Tax=Methylobacterium segetis TaxID=2488750 RepID=UPI001051028D|nr:hypothetical protein [Methylobacterium segetis]
MPRFFIDSDDGELHVDDNEGLDLKDAVAARVVAIALLPEMARQKLSDSDLRTFNVRVRDEQGEMIYTADLILRGEWKVPAEMRQAS